MVRVTIDGRECHGRPDQTILEVARENGISIPTLCYHEKLSLIKSCRICLVEVEGAEIPMASCATPIVDGMVVHTRTDRVEQLRREALKLLLVNHPLDCPVCDAGGECQLQNRTYEFGITKNEFPPETVVRPPVEYGTPLIKQWFDRCVMCLRCIHACIDIPGADVLDVKDRGFSSFVEAVRKENCISCGECLSVCPVGALTENLSPIKGRTWQLVRTQTTCPFCGCGCQLELNTVGKKKVVKVTTRAETGVNRGSLCVRGRFGYDFIHHPDRIQKPMIRKPGGFVEATWQEALDLVALKLREVKWKYEAEAIAGITSSRATNEENYLFQKWMRACIGTNHIDNGGRLANGAALWGMLASLGLPGMTHPMDHVTQSDLILLVGADVYSDHLIFSNKMREAMRSNNAKILLVDPRKTQWEKWANCWLRPRPGTDIVWISGLIHYLIEQGISPRESIAANTEGFEAMRSSVKKFTPQMVQELTGIAPSELETLSKLYAAATHRAIVFGPGVVQHVNGTETVKALCNLALLTGEAEESGGGVYPMLTQNNAQGACDMGGLPEFLPGYERVDDGQARKRFEQAWGKEIPRAPGCSYVEIFDQIGAGRIKALYVFGEDPLISLPNREQVRTAIRQLEFLVVQDSFMSHIAEEAHVVLPGVTFAEKDGTFTNMERRIQRVRQAVSPLGEARADWRILCDLSTRMGYGMDYQSPAHVMEEISSLIPLYAEARYVHLEQGGIQWGPPAARKRRFFPVEYRELPEKPDRSYPLWIVPGGFHYHYGIGTTTKRAKGLAKVFRDTCIELHPEDAARANLAEGDWVRVVSPRGEIETRCAVSKNVPEGMAYLALSFFPVFANDLLMTVQDPISHNPEYRAFVGRVEKR